MAIQIKDKRLTDKLKKDVVLIDDISSHSPKEIEKINTRINFLVDKIINIQKSLERLSYAAANENKKVDFSSREMTIERGDDNRITSVYIGDNKAIINRDGDGRIESIDIQQL